MYAVDLVMNRTPDGGWRAQVRLWPQDNPPVLLSERRCGPFDSFGSIVAAIRQCVSREVMDLATRVYGRDGSLWS